MGLVLEQLDQQEMIPLPHKEVAVAIEQDMITGVEGSLNWS